MTRSYRVAMLTADEAERLTRDAEGEFHPVIKQHCCEHLDVFHNRGQRDDGSHWKACTIWGCKCEGEDTLDEPHVVARRKTRELLEKQDRWDIARAWLMLGLVIGVVVGWVVS